MFLAKKYRERSPILTRTGFTMLELIVSLTVVGLLLAILLPSVQQVRATSSRLSCQNHMHQLGLAMHNFHDVNQRFPGTRYLRDLLPYLGYQVLSEKLDIHCMFNTLEEVALNENCFKQGKTPVFACPSDPLQSSISGRVTNYLINQGTGFKNRNDGFLSQNYEQGRAIAARDVRDGLSQTVAYSEKLIYAGDEITMGFGSFVPSRDQAARRMATTDPYYQSDQLDQFANACEFQSTFFGGTAGFLCTWSLGDCGSYDYNHIMTPNSVSCFNGLPDSGFQSVEFAARTSNSYHYSGVNSLLGDGSVRFFHEGIDEKVWRALGTRNGSESFSIEGF